MIVPAKVISASQIETVQVMGHGPRVINCTFKSVVPAIGSTINIESNDIIQGEILATYKMRNPL